MVFEIIERECQLFVYKKCPGIKIFCFWSDFDETLWDCSTHEFNRSTTLLGSSLENLAMELSKLFESWLHTKDSTYYGFHYLFSCFYIHYIFVPYGPNFTMLVSCVICILKLLNIAYNFHCNSFTGLKIPILVILAAKLET